jgi:serine protease Do
MSDPSEYLVEAFGILGIPLTEQTAPGRVAALRLPSGLVVASSSRPQTPWGDRLRPGDVLYAVDGERVESPESLRTLLDKRKGERVVAEVLRGSQMHYLVLPVDE